MEDLLKVEVYKKIKKEYRRLGRALRSRKRLGYDAIFRAISRIDELMIARNSWERV